MRHDVQLRELVRDRYDLSFLPPENPAFEDAERRRTPAYLETVEAVEATRAASREWTATRQQLRLI